MVQSLRYINYLKFMELPVRSWVLCPDCAGSFYFLSAYIFFDAAC